MNMHPSFLALAALAVLTSNAPAQSPPALTPEGQPSAREREQDADNKLRAEEPAILGREARIDAELKALDRAALKDDDWAKEWAGTYYTGDGLGMNVVIKVAPKSGLSYTWHGCLGLYDGDHGDIVETFPDGLKVKLAIGASHYQFMSDRLYFVRWGDRRYLVPEAQMTQLVNNYNQGGYARSEMYSIPLRIEGEQFRRRTPEPAGKPVLPPKYDNLLMAKPWRLTIAKVTDKPERTVTGSVCMLESDVELEGGKDQGVYPGMEISMLVDRASGSLRIDRVEEKRCWGKLTMFGDTGMKAPPVGTVLTAGGLNAVGEAKKLLGGGGEKK